MKLIAWLRCVLGDGHNIIKTTAQKAPGRKLGALLESERTKIYRCTKCWKEWPRSI